MAGSQGGRGSPRRAGARPGETPGEILVPHLDVVRALLAQPAGRRDPVDPVPGDRGDSGAGREGKSSNGDRDVPAVADHVEEARFRKQGLDPIEVSGGNRVSCLPHRTCPGAPRRDRRTPALPRPGSKGDRPKCAPVLVRFEAHVGPGRRARHERVQAPAAVEPARILDQRSEEPRFRRHCELPVRVEHEPEQGGSGARHAHDERQRGDGVGQSALERARAALVGRAVERLDRARLAERVLAPEERLGPAADRVARILELEPVRVDGIELDPLDSFAVELEHRLAGVPRVVEEDRALLADRLELVRSGRTSPQSISASTSPGKRIVAVKRSSTPLALSTCTPRPRPARRRAACAAHAVAADVHQRRRRRARSAGARSAVAEREAERRADEPQLADRPTLDELDEACRLRVCGT